MDRVDVPSPGKHQQDLVNKAAAGGGACLKRPWRAADLWRGLNCCQLRRYQASRHSAQRRSRAIVTAGRQYRPRQPRPGADGGVQMEGESCQKCRQQADQRALLESWGVFSNELQTTLEVSAFASINESCRDRQDGRSHVHGSLQHFFVGYVNGGQV